MVDLFMEQQQQPTSTAVIAIIQHVVAGSVICHLAVESVAECLCILCAHWLTLVLFIISPSLLHSSDSSPHPLQTVISPDRRLSPSQLAQVMSSERAN